MAERNSQEETMRLLDEAMAEAQATGYAEDRRQVEALERDGLIVEAAIAKASNVMVQRLFDKHGTLFPGSR
jgi:hypothetical protein